MNVHSLMKNYTVDTGYSKHSVMVTAVRMNNDINGNPRHKVQVWLWKGNYGSIWSPTIKGYRRSKDDTYVLKGAYNLEDDLDSFMKLFESCVQDF